MEQVVISVCPWCGQPNGYVSVIFGEGRLHRGCALLLGSMIAASKVIEDAPLGLVRSVARVLRLYPGICRPIMDRRLMIQLDPKSTDIPVMLAFIFARTRSRLEGLIEARRKA